MRMILICSGKGGAGKTTLARELAVAAVAAGRRVALADLDPQLGLTGWFSRRQADAPAMVALPAGHNLTAVAAAGVQELFIDLPPGLPTYVSGLVAKADAVLVPCRPSPDDLAASSGVVALLAQHPQWAFVLTHTLPRSRLTGGALRQLAALGRVAPVSLGLRQDYPAAAISGLAAVEFSGTKSCDEVNQLRSYVDKLMGLQNGEAA